MTDGLRDRALAGGTPLLEKLAALTDEEWAELTHRLTKHFEREMAERGLSLVPTPVSTAGFVTCPLCHGPVRTEDVVGGVCLECADAIAFSQNARRGAISVQAAD